MYMYLSLSFLLYPLSFCYVFVLFFFCFTSDPVIYFSNKWNVFLSKAKEKEIRDITTAYIIGFLLRKLAEDILKHIYILS